MAAKVKEIFGYVIFGERPSRLEQNAARASSTTGHVKKSGEVSSVSL